MVLCLETNTIHTKKKKRKRMKNRNREKKSEREGHSAAALLEAKKNTLQAIEMQTEKSKGKEGQSSEEWKTYAKQLKSAQWNRHVWSYRFQK